MRVISKTKVWLVVSIVIFVFLRFPSLVEPNWYGDEGVYQVVGNAMNSGRILYQQIWDNKPPLLYVIYALSNSNLYTVKLLSLLAGLFSVASFYLLASKIFKKKISIIASTILFAILFGGPILEGNIANSENFMLFTTILSAYFINVYIGKRKTWYLVISGLLLSFSLLLKVVAVFDFTAFLVFIILSNRNLTFLKTKDFVLFFMSFLSLMIISGLHFFYKGAFGDFIQAVFFRNLSYVGEQNTFVLPMGGVAAKTILLLVILFLFVKFVRRVSGAKTFIYLWMLFGLYSVFFSERPYTHYLLLLLAPFCLLFGSMIGSNKHKIVDNLILVTICLISFFQFQLYKNSFDYYVNFLNFMTGSKSVVEYESFFDENTPRDYMLADFIKTNIKKDEGLFLWTDRPQVYALSDRLPIGKYIVAYHIKFYDNADLVTYEQIEKVKPKYIIQIAQGPVVDNILSSYQLKYVIDGAKIYER